MDYVSVPHEQLASFSKFSMQSMSGIINEFNLHNYKTAIVFALNIQDETSVAEVTKPAGRVLN